MPKREARKGGGKGALVQDTGTVSLSVQTGRLNVGKVGGGAGALECALCEMQPRCHTRKALWRRLRPRMRL